MRLARHVKALLEHGFANVVAIDDGSPSEFRTVFDALSGIGGCTVLRHESNRGKGAALKTGFAWVLERLPDVAGAVTCDADGQHTPEDCAAVAKAMLAGPRGIYLGCRRFSTAGVPLRSRFGNFWTSVLFWVFHGTWLADTQTGLRAFRREELKMMSDVPGDRCGYEMAVLCMASRAGIRMRTVPVATVYERGNPTSHFSPLGDSLEVCGVLLADFMRYAGVSFSSFLLDQALAWAFHSLFSAAALSGERAIWASGCTARLASSLYNYLMNKAFVFGDRRSLATSAWRYALLCVAVICVSNAAVAFLSNVGVSRGVAKMFTDTVLYFAAYAAQRRWVFRQEAFADRIRPTEVNKGAASHAGPSK